MTVRIWKVDTGACIAILKGHTRGISDVAWAPDSLHLATASDDTLIHLWSLPPSASASASAGPVEVAPCKVLQGHTNYVFCVEFGPTGGMLASGSFDESVRFWDVRAGKVGAGGGERAVAAHADPVTSVAFGPDGSILASCSYDGLMYGTLVLALTWAVVYGTALPADASRPSSTTTIPLCSNLFLA